MAPFESASTDDPDGVPDYFTPERLVGYAILGSARQTLNYRYFLVQNASRTIDEIQAGRLDRWSPVAEGERQNLVRALNAQIIQETVAIIEALTAVSMNPDDPPEDQAKQLLTYRTGEIYDFYRLIDEDVGHDRLASIFSYPDIEDLDIAETDEEWYQAYVDGNLEGYREFFLVAKQAWDVLKQARNKITHGFFIFMSEQQTLVTKHGEPVELPDWADDYLATADWEDDDFEPHVLLMGDEPRSHYLSICTNAITVMDQDERCDTNEHYRSSPIPLQSPDSCCSLYTIRGPELMMFNSEYKDDLLIAVALTEFSVHYEEADPGLANHAWQLAANRLVDHDVEPAEAVAELEIGASRGQEGD